jgi:hypothetical protein
VYSSKLPARHRTPDLRQSIRGLGAAEKVSPEEKLYPQRLKPHSFQDSYVRPKGRTLQIDEFFRSLFSPKKTTFHQFRELVTRGE